MNRVSSEQLAQDRAGVAAPIAARRTLIRAAWISTLLLSNLPLVIAREIFGRDLPWIGPAWIGIASLSFALTYAWTALKPLRGYFLIMGVIALLAFVNPFITQSTFWVGLLSGRPQIVSVFADRVLLVLETLVVLATLFLMGVKRREAFLSVGKLNAPVRGRASTAKKRGLTWPVLGTVITLLLGGGFFFFMAAQNPGWSANIAAVLPWMPLILFSAALNAFGEEAKYRAAPLATLIPAVGPGQGLWLTSLWFGLGHYYGGIPSGPIGLVMSGGIGLIMGKAMIDTRGIVLPWSIHMVLDTIIYFFIAAAI